MHLTVAFFILGKIIWQDVSAAIVRVEQGRLEGELKWTVTGDKSFYSFKGIPYAAPPIGKRRFMAPLPARPWKGIRNATVHGSVCPQLNPFKNMYIPGDEDCLFLNVYTPTLSPCSQLPVMFFIHGGGYVAGSGNDDNYGADFIINQNDVVVVTINYRLDNLGFMCMESADVPGNAGMKDQVEALRWVRRNIRTFGGDPNQVTIFGQSAGSACVTLHTLSPMSKGLFQRAIAMSGVPINDFTTAFEQRRRAFALGKSLGFETANATALLEFLQTVPVQELVGTSTSVLAAEDYIQFPLKSYLTVPVVETDFGQERFLIEQPLTSIEKGIHDVDMLLGYTSNEGIYIIPFVENSSIIANYDRFPEVLVPRDILYQLTPVLQLQIADVIREHYTGCPMTSLKTISKLVSFTTDLYIYPIIRYARLLSIFCGRGDIYLFEFSSMSERGVWSQKGDKYGLEGVAHNDILTYVFQANGSDLPVNKNATSYKMIQHICALFTNFAIFGNPTPDESLGVAWPAYDAEFAAYLDIEEDLTLRSYPRASTMKFWEGIYELANIPF